MNLPPLVSALLALLCGSLLLSCNASPGPGPGPSPSPQDPLRSLHTRGTAPNPTARMAARSGENLETIGTGYWVFQRKCLECHEARVPNDPGDADWHPVMEGMTWNAGLSGEEQRATMAYLRAAAR